MTRVLRHPCYLGAVRNETNVLAGWDGTWVLCIVEQWAVGSRLCPHSDTVLPLRIYFHRKGPRFGKWVCYG